MWQWAVTCGGSPLSLCHKIGCCGSERSSGFHPQSCDKESVITNVWAKKWTLIRFYFFAPTLWLSKFLTLKRLHLNFIYIIICILYIIIEITIILLYIIYYLLFIILFIIFYIMDWPISVSFSFYLWASPYKIINNINNNNNNIYIIFIIFNNIYIIYF